MSLAGENQPADGRPEVSDYDWDGSDDEHESPSSAYDSDISDEPNEPWDEIPRDERGPPFVFVTAEPGNEHDQRENDSFPFTGELTGPRDTTPRFDHPADCFQYFLDEEIMQFLCDNTNAKARIFFGPDLKRKINGILWHDIDPQKLYIFFALNFLMGLTKLPKIESYWHHDPLTGGPSIFCSKVMSRNKWKNIMKCLRFTHQDTVVLGQPGTRIEPFLNKLRVKCRSCIHPGLHIAIDEALILYKGRLHFRQCIRTKRSRFGIKVFLNCPGDPKYQGYTYDFEVYYGEATNFYTPDNPGNLSVSEEIVVRLLCDLLDCGRHVVTDNWYTSLRLARVLLDRRTDITGTINTSRGIPAALKDMNLNKKQSAFMRSGDILCCKYEDRKSVYSMTTRYTARIVEKTKKYYSGQTFYKLPFQIDRYNDYMGSVDKADQVLEPYSWKRKSLAWFKKLGLHFLDRMIFNSFIVYANAHDEYKKDYVEFIRDVSDELIRRYSPGGRAILEAYDAAHRPTRPVRPRIGAPQRQRLPRARPQPHVSSSSSPPSGEDPGEGQPTPRRWSSLVRRRRREQRRQSAIAEQEAIAAQEAIDAQAAREAEAAREQEARDAEQASRDQAAIDQVAMVHMRVKKPPTAKKNHPQAKCVQCTRSGKRKDTRFICNLCPNQRGMCSTECFEIFHLSLRQPGLQFAQAAPPRDVQVAPQASTSGAQASTSRASRSNTRRRLQEPASVLPSGEYFIPDTDPDDPASTGSSSN